MNAVKQKEEFKRHLVEIVEAFREECGAQKRLALRVRICAVCLSAVVTVCLGLKSTGMEKALGDVALVLSALITVVGAYEAFFDPRSLWIRETIIYTQLRNLKREFEFWNSGCDAENLNPEQVEKLEKFQQKLDQILMDSLKNWMRIRGVSDPETKTQRKHSEEAREEVESRRP